MSLIATRTLSAIGLALAIIHRPLDAQTVDAAASAPPPADSVPTLGELRFPTSAGPAARAAFERGVLYLHNFHYPQAAAAFGRARSLDSTDVMSAAFEALSYTHAVWNQQDTAQGRAALRTLAPTRAVRLSLARSPRERAWLDAIEGLYDGDVPKPVRDTAFSRAMARLHAADPADPEAATFYALSLLGLNQGDREPRAYAQAEAVVDTVLATHPRHPGALHYKIHAVDDPQNARRGLAAARAYGEVAPSAGHALHMTSHIYIALGMWDDVVAANRRAAATATHVFGHGTHWLVYGLLQQGRAHEARAWVDSMLGLQQEVAAGARAVRGRSDVSAHAVRIPATYIVDAEAWDTPLARLRPDTAGLEDLATRSMADFIVGYAAARRASRPVDLTPGSRAADRLVADSMLARMTARNASARGANGPEATELGQAEVMEQTLRAELVWADGRRDSAVAMLRATATRLEALPYAFGPPPTIKPPRERAAEMLIFMNRPADALAELDLAERMAPRRTMVMLRRARALDVLGRRVESARVYKELAAIWHQAEPDYPWLAESRWGSGDVPAAERIPVVTDTITYTSGALRLRGVLVRPARGPRHGRPAIVVLHGSNGAWSPPDITMLGHMFAAHGYVVFFPFRRGQGLSEGQGTAWAAQLTQEGLAPGDSAFFGRMTELLVTTQLADVRAAIAAMRARREVNPRRVVVSGISFGGILTLLAAEADSTLRAAVAFAPAAMNWGPNASLRERLTSAAHHIRVPTLVLQAENDWNVGPAQVLGSALREGGNVGEGRIYPAVGGNASTGHALMLLTPDLWRTDVFAFLDARVPRVK